MYTVKQKYHMILLYITNHSVYTGLNATKCCSKLFNTASSFGISSSSYEFIVDSGGMSPRSNLL